AVEQTYARGQRTHARIDLSSEVFDLAVEASLWKRVELDLGARAQLNRCQILLEYAAEEPNLGQISNAGDGVLWRHRLANDGRPREHDSGYRRAQAKLRTAIPHTERLNLLVVGTGFGLQRGCLGGRVRKLLIRCQAFQH